MPTGYARAFDAGGGTGLPPPPPPPRPNPLITLINTVVNIAKTVITTAVNVAYQRVTGNTPSPPTAQTGGGGQSSTTGTQQQNSSSSSAPSEDEELRMEERRRAAQEAERRDADIQRRNIQRDISQQPLVDLVNIEYEFFGDSLPANATALMQYAFAQNDWDESGVRTSWTWNGEVMRRTGAASIEQGLSSLTTELLIYNMGNNSLAFSQMSPRDQALYIRDVLIPEGEANTGVSGGSRRGRTTQEVILQFIDNLETQRQDLGIQITDPVNSDYYRDLQNTIYLVDDTNEWWQQLEGTFGVSDDMTLDVLEWASDNISNLDVNNARLVEEATRNYLYQQIRTVGSNASYEDLQKKSLSQLLELYNTEAQAYIDEQEAMLQAPFEADLDTAYGAYLDEMNNSPFAYTKDEFAEMGDWYTSRTPDLRYISPELGRIEQLNNALNNNYESPPDANLLLMIGTIFIEPLDWVVTGVEIIQDISKGDWGSAVVNAGLLALPFVSGRIDDALGYVVYAPDHKLTGGLSSGEADDIISSARSASFTGIQRGFPLGFDDYEDYLDFGYNIQTGLNQIGIEDVQVIFVGSSVTGVSFRTGDPFSAASDFDIALSGSDLFDRANALGIDFRSTFMGGHTRTGPLTQDEINALGFGELHQQLLQKAGREVNFMIYESLEAFQSRGEVFIIVPTIGD